MSRRPHWAHRVGSSTGRANDAAGPGPGVHGDRGRDDGYRLPQLPAIDGLRAVAVSAVLLYHLPEAWFPGGFLGVDVFFVISGFLITSLVTVEVHRTGRINLGHFWLRRARRLLPALFFMLVIIVAVSSIFARDALSLLASDLPAVLGYFTNWWLIFHHVSYFQSVGRPPLVLHLWSLAVEEQFYLVWPLIILSSSSAATAGRSGSAGSLSSEPSPPAPWMALLFQASGPLEGLLRHRYPRRRTSPRVPPWPSPFPRGAARPRSRPRRVGSWASSGWPPSPDSSPSWRPSTSSEPFTYRGGIQLATVLTAVIILVVTHPAVRERPDPGHSGAPVDREALLRHLPVALAHLLS
jgi:hypothetical protein